MSTKNPDLPLTNAPPVFNYAATNALVEVTSRYLNQRYPKGNSREIHEDLTVQQELRAFSDALAALAISQADHEVVAVVVRPNKKKRSVALILASNAPTIRENTKEHLKRMWEMAVKIYKAYRRSSAELATSDSKALQHEAMLRAYIFSVAKVHKKLAKYTEIFERVKTARLSANYENEPDSARSFDEELSPTYSLFVIFKRIEDVSERCLSIKEALKAWATYPSPVNWQDVVNQLEFVDDGRRFLAQVEVDAFDGYYPQLRINNGPNGKPDDSSGYRLLRAFSKSAAIHGHVRNLGVFAKLEATTEDSFLDYSLEFDIVPAFNKHNVDDWPAGKAASKSLAERAGMISSAFVDAYIVNPLTLSSPLRKHCELNIAQYLEAKMTNIGSAQIHVYIGVSKLCCLACDRWLEAFNDLSSSKLFFEVQGCHGKLYSRWLLPNIAAEKDEIVLRQAIVTMCTAAIKNGYSRDRTHSDSTNPASVLSNQDESAKDV